MPTCRFCSSTLLHTFADLGKTPLANRYLTPVMLLEEEPVYPLHARVCSQCFLVQVESVVPADEIFSHYAYFSSYSHTWVQHARHFAQTAIQALSLTNESRVLEIASNDGYLLQHFVEAGISCLGIEPAQNVAQVAQDKGIPTKVAFFSQAQAETLFEEGYQADLVIANNVLAHVPDLNDFVSGLKTVLKPTGLLSIEVPHLLRLIEQTQFDTIYHEHFCYFSLYTLERVFKAHGLMLVDAEALSTHGGSLRLSVRHADPSLAQSERLTTLKQEELDKGLHQLDTYQGFQQKIMAIRDEVTGFLEECRANGKTVAAYGAAAKGNTLLNVCQVTTQQIEYVVDNNTHKQWHYLPGSRIPIYPVSKVFATHPDYLLVLPWNLMDEIASEMQDIRQWGCRFVRAIPGLEVLS